MYSTDVVFVGVTLPQFECVADGTDSESVCLFVCQYIYSHISELLHSKQIYQFEKGQITRKIN